MSVNPPHLVSVIILSCNHWDYTERLLTSLEVTSCVCFEIILIDNGSDEVTCQRIQEFAALSGSCLDIQFVFNATNLGIASGRNQGAALANGQLFLFMDNDIEVRDPNWLEILINTWHASRNIGALGAVLLSPDGKVQFCGGQVDQLGRVTLSTELNTLQVRRKPAITTMFCLGACLLTSRAAWELAGGFDPEYDLMDYEDIDYCLKLHVKGLHSLICTQVCLTHYAHITTGVKGFKRIRQYLISGRVFLQRWRNFLSTESW